ncbi:protoporphyrinogen oxidase [Terrilactibacillus sp. S3-3]|nr:protoporphyrinogen oxidase [Terrilactibacillus sp. S3-3]
MIEKGPDSFLKRKPAALELVNDLGLAGELVSNHTGKSYILRGGRLHIIPEGSVMGVPGQLKPFLDSALLSDDGKARVLDDLFMPALPPYEDMSVGDFFEKRLGHEMVESIIAPLLSGVYGGKIYRLSLAATLPQFKEIEKKSRSLILGVNGKAPRKKSSQFATLRTGLSALVDSLAAHLGSRAKMGAGIVRIEKTPDRYQLDLSNGERVMADGVVLAIPHAGVEKLFPNADYLRRPHADPDTSVATVAMAFDAKDVKLSLEGTGFVVSRKEPVSITAATWTHLKWPHTAPEGKALLRAFVGKPGDEAIVDKSDDALIAASLRDLRNIDDIRGSKRILIFQL